MNQYQQEIENSQAKLLKDLNSIQSKYVFEITTKNDDKYVSLKGLIPIYVNHRDYTKRYRFSLWVNLPFVNGYHDQSRHEENNKEPQGVGVLSKTKVINWVEYLIKEYEYLVELSKERTIKINAFLAEIEKLNGDKRIDTDYYHGTITKNGIEFHYEIGDTGYISKSLKLRTYPSNDDLENFKMLSDNKFIKPQEN